MRQQIKITIDGKSKVKDIKLRGVMPKPKQVIQNKKDKERKRSNKQWLKQID
jgi:hypothetical protein